MNQLRLGKFFNKKNFNSKTLRSNLRDERVFMKKKSLLKSGNLLIFFLQFQDSKTETVYKKRENQEKAYEVYVDSSRVLVLTLLDKKVCVKDRQIFCYTDFIV